MLCCERDISLFWSNLLFEVTRSGNIRTFHFLLLIQVILTYRIPEIGTSTCDWVEIYVLNTNAGLLNNLCRKLTWLASKLLHCSLVFHKLFQSRCSQMKDNLTDFLSHERNYNSLTAKIPVALLEDMDIADESLHKTLTSARWNQQQVVCGVIETNFWLNTRLLTM